MVVIDWRLCALYKMYELWVKVLEHNLKHFPEAICQDVNKKALYFATARNTSLFLPNVY